MTPQFQQHAQHTELEYVSRTIPAIVGVTLLMGLFAPVALASPADCQVVDLSHGGATESITSWKDTSLRTLPLTVTVQRDLLPAPFLEAAPLLRSTRFNRGISSENTCWSQSFRTNTVVNHAMIRSVGKGPLKSFTPVMRVPALPYNGKRQILQARTILPDMAMTPRDRTPRIIGPVQENAKVDQANIPNLNHAIAMRPSHGASLPLFEQRPILATDALQTGFRLQVNESLRMNMTTTQALHGGNCASGCP